MIIAGESSGELYGAFLATELKAKNNNISILGVGGQKMLAAGVQLISGISSSFGLIEAIKTLRESRQTFVKVVSAISSFKPQVLVLIDYPDFNLRVAKAAKKAGVTVLYYVSPQVWAWRKNRIKAMRRLVDKVAVILPFEERLYKEEKIPCEFVGHPILDEIREVLGNSGAGTREIGTEKLKMEMRRKLGLIPDKPVMTIMPGSRPHEIEKLLPLMIDVVAEIKKKYPDYQFLIPIAPNLNRNALDSMLETLDKSSEHSLVVTHNPINTLLASDVAVIASGTSTLQAAVLKVPMVVVYKLSPLTYFLGKLIVSVRHISLANILFDYIGEAGLRVRELLQQDANRENVMEELTRILEGREYRDKMLSRFEEIMNFFADKKASFRAAQIAEELGAGINV